MFSQEIDELISEGIGTKNIFFVRERGFSKFAAETQCIFRMVGVSDMVVWDKTGKTFDQITPQIAKLHIGGAGNAKKEDVAKGLQQYVGKQEYKTDDESDSVAIGIAWLLKNEYEVKKRE